MSDWVAKFANNGWMNWYCPVCGELVANKDVHVKLDWKYCPYCGKKVSEEDVKAKDLAISQMYILRKTKDLCYKWSELRRDGKPEEAEKVLDQINVLGDFYDEWCKDFGIEIAD